MHQATYSGGFFTTLLQLPIANIFGLESLIDTVKGPQGLTQTNNKEIVCAS